MRLENKIAIVTGGAQGIGKRTVEIFGENGAKIVIADVNDEIGKNTEEELKEKNIDATFIKTNVSKEEDVVNLINKTVDKYSGLHILVNNAATTLRKTAEETTYDEWKRVMSINLDGTFLCSKYAIPEMRKSGGGSIINVASWHADKTITRYAAYASSKGGVTALTRQMALDFGKDNIRVNGVLPSTVDTPMFYETLNELPDPDRALKETLEFQPMRRIGTSDDIANAILFLASDESAYVNGHSLRVDGGAYVKIARPLIFD